MDVVKGSIQTFIEWLPYVVVAYLLFLIVKNLIAVRIEKKRLGMPEVGIAFYGVISDLKEMLVAFGGFLRDSLGKIAEEQVRQESERLKKEEEKKRDGTNKKD
jgi:hypothetical protein